MQLQDINKTYISAKKVFDVYIKQLNDKQMFVRSCGIDYPIIYSYDSVALRDADFDGLKTLMDN